MLSNDATIFQVKHELMKAVAKYAFEGVYDEKRDQIPYELSPGPNATFRCCVYREREVLRERIVLAEGGTLHEGDYNMIQVIPAACHGCPITRFSVTDNCQKCMQKACQNACKFGAITMGSRKAEIDPDKCRECGQCAKACPYNAIADLVRPCKKACPVDAIKMETESGIVKIDQDKCIQCGACIHSCPFGAIGSRAGIVKVINAIKAGKRVVAMVAPAAEGQFGKGITMTSWRTALKKLGFSDMVEVALGGDLTAQAEAAEWAEAYKEGKKMTTSCCPAFVNMVRKHFPTLSDHISTSVSPMCGVSRMLKAEDPDCITVFIGPCVAKKSEMQDQKIEGNADFVMLFSEVLPMLEARGIELEPEEYDKQQASIFGKHFAHSHGVTDAVVQSLKETGESTDIKVEVCNGAAECKKALMLMKAGRLKADFIEGMACPGGCVGGPGARMPIPMFKKNREECLSKTEDITIEDSIKKHVGETLKFSMHRS